MVTTNTFISDTVLFVRNNLSSTITDPIASSRSGRERFVMTSYPQREVKYPIITVRYKGGSDLRRSGMQSETHLFKLPIEIRIWARNEKERDNLSEQVYNQLRSNQFGSGSSSEQELHDFKLVNSVDVDEDGDAGIKSRILNVQYLFIVGG